MQGQVIAERYQLVECLGQGAMGSVWLGRHLLLGSEVAVKLVSGEMARRPEAIQRFYREATLAAQINSAHVVRVLDFGPGPEPEGGAYMVMERLRGESLLSRLETRGRLSLPETVGIITHLCRAMSAAHELGLVHRDLKPANVFISQERAGEDEIVKVLDFGVAKAPDVLCTAGLDPTRTGALLGTPYYMSPEQAQGRKDIDGRSDVWSIAVVAFECLVGKRPFRASALGPLIAKLTVGPIPVPSVEAPEAGIPPAVDHWMSRALVRDPAQRIQTAAELASSLVAAVS
ncbi:MAG: serine/threonine protein kinase [Deltaproteobacteria bacterium]|nr:MAG: serine/threonine protein kinase [Deltaproteobacteria bacterium]